MTKTFKIKAMKSYKTFNNTVKQAISYKKSHPSTQVCVETPRGHNYCIVKGRKAFKVSKRK